MPAKEVETDDVTQDQESVNHGKDNASLKRAREGSQEPTPSPNPVPIAPPKRNRLATTSEESTHVPDVETGKVGEVRRKVQEMTWKEGAATGAVAGASEQPQDWEEIKDEEVEEAKALAKEDTQEQTPALVSSQSSDLKRKSLERNASSVLESAEPAKKSKESPSPPPTATEIRKTSTDPTSDPADAPVPAKKPQTTFGAFSSSASPFSSARTSSPFASASSSSAAPAGKAPTSGSAFGNYSSSFSAFAKKPPTVPTPTTSTSEPKDTETGNAGGPSSSSFGDILKSSKADEGEEADKVHMTEKDVYTGEEDEETLYQCRTKLYVMQADGGWKERGVGALRLNVRASDGKGARLVMRAEGVLRLILNVSLYVGMACLEDGKHVRSTVFEENEKRFITFRLGTQKAAAELCANIQEHIPLESTSKSPAADAPSPSPAVGLGKGEEAV